MPETPSEQPEGPDVRAIRHLVRLMKKYDLTALDLEEGTTRIRLRRKGPELHPASPPSAAPPPTPSALTHPVPDASVPPANAALPAPLHSTIVIESPMVGTYYASMTPDAPPFVSVGTKIRSDQTVCIIEAMKVFTDIPAGVNGTITEVLIKSGQSVEYGQPMFRVSLT